MQEPKCMYLNDNNNNNKSPSLVMVQKILERIRKDEVKAVSTRTAEQQHFPTDAGVWFSVKLTSNFLASANVSFIKISYKGCYG